MVVRIWSYLINNSLYALRNQVRVSGVLGANNLSGFVAHKLSGYNEGDTIN